MSEMIDLTDELSDRLNDALGDVSTVYSNLPQEQIEGYIFQLKLDANRGYGNAMLQLGIIAVVEEMREEYGREIN